MLAQLLLLRAKRRIIRQVGPITRIGAKFFRAMAIADVTPAGGTQRPVLVLEVLDPAWTEFTFAVFPHEDHGKGALRALPLATLRVFQEFT